MQRPYFYGWMTYCLRGLGCKRRAASLFFAISLLAGSPLRAADDAQTLILAFGDSLTAGYELPQGDSFPSQLEAYLRREKGINAKVVNAGVSGDTTSGGRARLDWVLDGVSRKPDLVILELGANDALRGIDPALVRRNLDTMLGELTSRGIRVLLAGMMAPPNMGDDYEREFNAIYPALAREYDLVLYPFFLEGVAMVPELKLPDGMHPTAEGVSVIVEAIAPYIDRALERPAPAAVGDHAMGSESGL